VRSCRAGASSVSGGKSTAARWFAPTLAREEANMSRMLRKFAADDSGMETVEWGVLAALIVAAVIGALTSLGANVKRQFDIMVNATQ
jgi:Flp pilus assembly pilin Flp